MEDRGETDCVTTPTGAELRRLPLASAEPRRTPCRASSQQMTKTYKILQPPINTHSTSILPAAVMLSPAAQKYT